MNDTIINFETLKETHDIECKAAQGRDGQGELPKDFWPSYSALANTDGGSIFLGVAENGSAFERLGIKKPEKVIKELIDTANNREKVSVNLIGNDDVIFHKENNATTIEVKIRRASRTERPVYIKNNPLGNSYRRRHEADQRMTDEQVKRMLADQQSESVDRRILKGFDLDDLDMARFKNPGDLRIPLETAYQGGESDSRNKSIQDMFRMIGAGERQGFGIHKILENWKAFDWRVPHFEEVQEPQPRVIVRLSMLSLFPEKAVSDLRSRYLKEWDRCSELEKIALILAHTEGLVTHQRLSQLSSEHSRELSTTLQKLEDQEMLNSIGQYRSKTYHLPGHE
ncbi:MAG: putative DNA binding domain-containing protein, partial [Verrucomicrobiales bacterium]|nr:putative DNA binding domain-containing protein [Verrucomicrobiales bacterium]